MLKITASKTTINYLISLVLSVMLFSGEIAFGQNTPLPANATQIVSKPLPESCETHCVTPYGQVLGTASGNVTAYSNCNAQCVIFEPNREAGTYTGIKWQCVEFARRWLLQKQGVIYGDVDTAADIWKLTTITNVADNKPLPFHSYPNGAMISPQVGDLLIYAKEFLGTGHVAVIIGLDKTAGLIKVAEQNFSNDKWSADYARAIDFLEKEGKYWLLDGYLLGWKHVQK